MINGSKPGDVVVWWMDLGAPTAERATHWCVCLDSAERARAARCRFHEDRHTYIAAHWLLRTALASVGGRPATEWRFVVEKLGKPRIDPVAGLPASGAVRLRVAADHHGGHRRYRSDWAHRDGTRQQTSMFLGRARTAAGTASLTRISLNPYLTVVEACAVLARPSNTGSWRFPVRSGHAITVDA